MAPGPGPSRLGVTGLSRVHGVWAAAHPSPSQGQLLQGEGLGQEEKNKHMEKYLRFLIVTFRSPFPDTEWTYNAGKLRLSRQGR